MQIGRTSTEIQLDHKNFQQKREIIEKELSLQDNSLHLHKTWHSLF